MTENEAIESLNEKYMDMEYYFAEHDCYPKEYDAEFQEAMAAAMKALKEIQQYRAIGTVDECREARERQRAKKPNITTGKTEEDKLACCPICEGNLDWTYNGFWRKGNPKYCSNCGQSIDWSDTP